MLRVLLAAAFLALTACSVKASAGYLPPNDSFAFPGALMLDPRVPPGGEVACDQDAEACGVDETCVAGLCRTEVRWLYVVNSNSDLRYNAGSLVAVDLDAFFGALHGKILAPEAKTSDETPCRHVTLTPSIVECDERAFVADESTVHFGSFAADVKGQAYDWQGDPERAIVIVPVRADPSLTWMTLEGGLSRAADDVPVLECGQGADVDERRCGDEYRMRYLQDDPDLGRIAREPWNVIFSNPTDPNESPLVFVTHQLDSDVTLVSLEGLRVDGDGLPIVVDRAGLFSQAPAVAGIGGYGMAERPCDPDEPIAGSGDCSQPVIYGGYRYGKVLQIFTTRRIDEGDLEPHQHCVQSADLDQPGAVSCEDQLEYESGFFAGGLENPSPGAPTLGAMAFSSQGDELFVVQSSPGALLKIDTSLNEDGKASNSAVGDVEVCARASALSLYEDGQQRLALVSCYRGGEVFIVDLVSLSVIRAVRIGTGPHAFAVDLAREVVYVGNTLDATVSVIDMSVENPTRFSEIARIGLQEVYQQ